MEESYSVCSPRRILSVSKKRREATVSFADPDIRASGFHGPKPAEVYGFVGSITTIVATVILLVWAYVPESWLHWIGIFYYPSRNCRSTAVEKTPPEVESETQKVVCHGNACLLILDQDFHATNWLQSY